MSFHVNDLKNSKFLKQSDVPKPMVVTIVGTDEVNVAKEGADPEMKYALIFKELEKPLVLNSTNGQIIAAIVGSGDSEDWIGHSVVLYSDPNVSFGGKLVGGLRVRARKGTPTQAKPTPTALTDDKAKRLMELRAKMSKPAEKTLDEINEEAELASQAAGDEEDEV